ncbi:nitrilase-related carbon-nitrogen hydrolase [Umezawaea tangerina]|nr:nitrilase-related carbon-nitrogen hydrolase [Umezawaea tangerina]
MPLVSVVQATPVPDDPGATVDKVGELVGAARAEGAELCLLPEAFVGGYPKGSTFGGYVGGRTDAGREEFGRYWESAITVPGPEAGRLAEVARSNRVHLVVGVVERAGGTLYCAVLTFGPDGALVGKRRKLMPTGAERMVWGFGDGSTLQVHDTALGRLGAVICWENYMPLLRTTMYHKGIEIYCAPTADGRPTWVSTMRHIAVEGRCFVLSCNQFARRSDFPAHQQNLVGAQPDDVVATGGSCIVGPLGEILAGPAWDGEQTLFAEIDLAALPRARYDFDAVGHCARPDVFRLTVDQTVREAVAYASDQDPTADPRSTR